MSVGLNGWHPGERSIQSRVGFAEPMATAYTWIEGSMREQHQKFYSQNLNFVPLTTLDVEGRPWASIVAGSSDKPGFMSSPDETQLILNLDMWPGDPMLENLDNLDRDGKLLVAGLGIEFTTRRRNKFAGWAFQVEQPGKYQRRVRMHVNQAIGNCPKYINVRDFEPHFARSPHVLYRNLHMSSSDRLPDELVSLILMSDTVFLSSAYKAKHRDERKFPSHVGMNARGGRAGFIRVLPSDGRTVILPDYSGNRLLTSLGNIEATPLAAMSFVDFMTGDILYLTGTARNLVGQEAQRIMPRQTVLTAMHVEGFVFIREALPFRQKFGTSVGRSPYSPPVKYLAEEKVNDTTLDDVYITLTHIKMLTPDLATFTFETSNPVKIIPGQAAVLDFTDLLGKGQYAHMAPGNEARINDDRIRTWTISSSHITGETRNFSLTMREKPGGLVTGALFQLARQASAKMPEILDDARPLGLRVKLVGIAGDFTLPSTPSAGIKKHLWVAGGIGITPFISMLSAISSMRRPSEYDITFIVSTREPDIMLRLIRDALPVSGSSDMSNVEIHLFSEQKACVPSLSKGVSVVVNSGRFSPAYLSKIRDIKERKTYLCGPLKFEEHAIDAFRSLGVDITGVTREGFGY